MLMKNSNTGSYSVLEDFENSFFKSLIFFSSMYSLNKRSTVSEVGWVRFLLDGGLGVLEADNAWVYLYLLTQDSRFYL